MEFQTQEKLNQNLLLIFITKLQNIFRLQVEREREREKERERGRNGNSNQNLF